MFRIQVLIDRGKPTERWADVRSSGGEPYDFDTEIDAESHLRLCYDADRSTVRIVEI